MQQGLPPISNQRISFFSAPDHAARAIPDLKSEDFIFLSPRSCSNECLRSQIRGFHFFSDPDHAARTAPDLKSEDFIFLSLRSCSNDCSRSQIRGFHFFSQPQIMQQGLPPISNQRISFLSAPDYAARTAPDLKSEDFIFRSPRSRSKDCLQSLIRGFLLSLNLVNCTPPS